MKPKEEYTTQQLQRVLYNLQLIMNITEPHLHNKALELIYTCANDSMCRLEGIIHYPPKESNHMNNCKTLITVDKELLREQLRSIIGTCSDCDLKHGIHCNKEACGYGLSDKLIDEIINNCTVEEMEDEG